MDRIEVADGAICGKDGNGMYIERTFQEVDDARRERLWVWEGSGGVE